MPSESYNARYPSLQEERAALDQVHEALRSEDWPRACSRVGVISEMVALARYAESQKTRPTNLPAAIDFMMNRKLIPRPLGQKMQLIRELRNIASHPNDPSRLPYTITEDDARISEQILKDLLSWMHGDKLRENWDRIVHIFDEAKEILNSEKLPDSAYATVRWLTNALRRAIDLKLYSLGIACTPDTDLVSKIERLIEAGIDTRSLAWRDFVVTRYDAHAKEPSAADLNHLRAQLVELREVLFKLQPTFGPLAF